MKKYLKQLKVNRKGFTLIEMIVVIGIIGILAAILVPSISGYLRNAKDTKKDANARTIYTAAQAAVTSLETSTTPVAGTSAVPVTYTKDSTGDSISMSPDTDAAEALFGKIEQLIGKSNYDKFSIIAIKVADGAVIQVTVTDASGEAKYPK